MNNVFRGKFPEWSAIEALSPEELAYELAMGLNQKRGQNPNVHFFKLTREKLVDAIAGAYGVTYERRLTLMTAVEASIRLGLLVEMEAGDRDVSYVFLTRSGLKITNADAATQHRQASLQAYDLLDPGIVERVWSTVLRGDYDIAVAYAFKRVEVEMRDKGEYHTDLFGGRLVKKFFLEFRLTGDENGPKPNTLTSVEQFFIGTLELYRNPTTHQDGTIDTFARAMEVLLIANHQLHLVRSAVRRTVS